MNSPAETDTNEGTLKLSVQLPLPSVVTVWKPRYFLPSPNPVGSRTVLLKNSSRNAVLALLLSVHEMVVLPPEMEAAVSTGKFCRWLEPSSASPRSLGVTPIVVAVGFNLEP